MQLWIKMMGAMLGTGVLRGQIVGIVFLPLVGCQGILFFIARWGHIYMYVMIYLGHFLIPWKLYFGRGVLIRFIGIKVVFKSVESVHQIFRLLRLSFKITQ